MKRSALALVLVSLACAQATAQDPFAEPSAAELQAANDPRAYMLLKMMERYDDPKNAVRRKAEQKAAERRGRLASQKWFGYSPLRPTANPLPWTSTYGQQWVGSAGSTPYYWVGRNYIPAAILQLDGVTR